MSLLVPLRGAALTQGPNSPTTGLSFSFSNPMNVVSSDDMRAEALLASTSAEISAVDFGFNIPPTATITGIVVEIEKNALDFLSGATADAAVFLLKSGVAAGSDRSDPNPWPSSDTYVPYGGTADLWGTTWSPAEINSAAFGASLTAIGQSAFARVDHIRITVHYSNCGDATVDSGEECDDGNAVDGDCCSAACLYETAGSACADDGEACTTDLCDGAGTCVHAAGNAGTPCRAATGECDIAETCDGVSSTCPADAFVDLGVPCGTSAVTDCSAADTCDGAGACDANDAADGTSCTSDGNACTVDACAGGVCGHLAGNAGATCRVAAGDCDVAEQCDGVSTTCPADSLAAAGTFCRAGAGQCDAAESCDGVSPTCPADAFEIEGTACDDANACTLDDECTSHGTCVGPPVVCDDGNPCSQDTCHPIDGCQSELAPATGCLTAATSILLLKDGDDSKDKLIWKWIKGADVSQADFADPTVDQDYALCIYAGGGSLSSTSIPSGASWGPIGTKGYKYKDAAGTGSGATLALLKSGSAGKSKVLVKGKGANLPDPTLGDLALPVTVQLHKVGGPLCLESVFDAADVKKNDVGQFKAKAQ